MRSGYRVIRFLIVAVVVASLLTPPLLKSVPSGAPGLYLTLVPTDPAGREVSGAYVAVQVSLTTPDGPMETVFAGVLGGPTVFIPYERIEKVVLRWVRESNYMFPAVVVDCWVINDDGELLASGTATVNYDPSELAGTRVLRAWVTVTVTPPGEVLRHSRALGTRHATAGTPEPLTWYVWRRVLYVAPENYTGSRYAKLPILILRNPRNTSTTLDIDVSTHPHGIAGMVTAVGYDLRGASESISKSRAPHGLTLMVAGPSLAASLHHVVAGGAYSPVPPGQVTYVWIKGRAVAEYQEEWVCAPTPAGYAACLPTGRERVVEYVSEVLTDPSGMIMMDAARGEPQLGRGFPKELKVLLSHARLEKIVVPGNMYLGDGKLDPGERFIINFVFKALRYTAHDQEVVTPVGAFLAAVLANVSVKYAWLAPILTLSSPTLIIQDGFGPRLIGSISNKGREPVTIYVGNTEMSYVTSHGVLRMPVAYFEALPPSTSRGAP